MLCLDVPPSIYVKLLKTAAKYGVVYTVKRLSFEMDGWGITTFHFVRIWDGHPWVVPRGSHSETRITDKVLLFCVFKRHSSCTYKVVRSAHSAGSLSSPKAAVTGMWVTIVVRVGGSVNNH